MLALFAQTPYPLSIEFQTGLIGLGILVLVVLKIWDLAKRKPALEETFASKKELGDAKIDRDAIRSELKALDERTDRKIDALDRRREAGEKDNRDLLHREIAGIKEFIGDKIEDNRNNNSERFGGIFAKLDTFQVSMQGLSNDVMHQIGLLKGQLIEVSKKADER